MPVLVRVGLLCLVALLGACAAPEPSASVAACRLEREAELPLRMVGGGFLVPARIDGHAVQLQLDTGASASMIEQFVAIQLGLPADPYRQTNLHGAGGVILSRNTKVDLLELGRKQWRGLSLSSGHLARRFQEDPPVAGLLGADRLANFDVELDLPHGRMTLWDVSHCEGDFVPWTAPHFAVPLVRANPNRMLLHVEVDGQPVTALVDWGARSTVVTTAAAERLGVTAAMLAQDRGGTSRGVDQTPVAFHLHAFAQIRIGNEVFHHISTEVADLHVTDVGMLLGADYARTRRIWLSYATRQMFVLPPALAALAAAE